MLSVDVLIVIAFAIYTIIFAFLRLDPRIGIGAALALMATAAVVLAVGNGDLANRLVIYACYFLASGGVLLLIDHVRGEAKKHKPRPMSTYSRQRLLGSLKRRRNGKPQPQQSREQVLDKGCRR